MIAIARNSEFHYLIGEDFYNCRGHKNDAEIILNLSPESKVTRSLLHKLCINY